MSSDRGDLQPSHVLEWRETNEEERGWTHGDNSHFSGLKHLVVDISAN